jgi:hypothetical protein
MDLLIFSIDKVEHPQREFLAYLSFLMPIRV